MISTYYVLNEHTLGFVFAHQPDVFCVLSGKILKGGLRWQDGIARISPLDTLRPATLADFEDYRCVPPPGFK